MIYFVVMAEFSELDKEARYVYAISNLEDTITQILEFEDINKSLGVLNELLISFYWKEKNLDRVFRIGSEAIKLAKEHDLEKSMVLSPIYYNLGSYTCPWWSDSLEISDEQAKEGMIVVKILLEMRESNDVELIKIAGAQWLLAAHYLYYAKDEENAIRYFELARKNAKEANDEELSDFLAANSTEGIGRTKIMLGNNIDEGAPLIKEAMKTYTEKEDMYSTKEAIVFLENHT